MEEEDSQKNIKSVYFAKKWNQIKQDHYEEIDKEIIQALKKLDTSYNPEFFN